MLRDDSLLSKFSQNRRNNMCGVVSRKKYKFVYPRERLRACAIYSIERERAFPIRDVTQQKQSHKKPSKNS